MAQAKQQAQATATGHFEPFGLRMGTLAIAHLDVHPEEFPQHRGFQHDKYL